MFSSLDKFGLPVKYAVIGAFGGVIAAAAFYLFGLADEDYSPVATIVGCAAGGAIGGWIRQRRGKSS